MAIQGKDYDLLKQYFGGPTGKPDSTDVAKFILLRAQTSKPIGPGMVKKTNPSLMSRIFDILSRTNYGVAEAIQSRLEESGKPTDLSKALPNTWLPDIWRGISGKDKTTFKDVLKTAGMEPGLGTSALGLGLDIGLDPLTYVPMAGIGSVVGKLGKLGKIAKPVEELSYAQKILNKGDPINPEAFGLPAKPPVQIPPALKAVQPAIDAKPFPVASHPRKGFTTRQPMLPGLELPKERIPLPEITLPKAAAAKALESPVGQTVLRFPNFTLKTARAEDVVEGVARGDLASTMRVTPMPKPKIEPRHQIAADDILRTWDPSKSTAQLNKKYPDSLNAKQQVGLYYKAIEQAKKAFKKPNSPANAAKVSSAAYKIYLATEKSLEARGLVPRIGTGENVRLSDVITQLGGHTRAKEVLDEFGSSIKEGSPAWQAVQGLRASGAIDEGRSVQLIADKVAEAKTATEASGLLSDGKLKDFDKFLKNFAEATAKADGVSPAGTSATKKLVELTLGANKSRAQIAVEQKSKMLSEIVATSKANPEVNAVLTRALEADLGTIPKWAVNDNKATEFFMGRIATWWGQKDLRPLSLNAIGSSAATAGARGKALDNLFAPYTQPQRLEAMRLAQGMGVATSPEVAQLASQIKRMVDNLVGNAGDSSVLLRSGVHMEMLNKWMRMYKVGFEFTRGKVKDITGKELDLSKGTDWTNTWKVASVGDDPKVFLFKLQQAMEQSTREKALFDELGERFGSKIPGKGYRTKVEGYPYLKGYYFTEDIAKQLPRVVKDWSIPAWAPGSPLIQHYDRIMSMWKTGVTIYRPGHHIRNMAGDVYLGWMDGVNTLKPYMLASKVIKSMKGLYDDVANVDELVRLGALPRTYASPKPNQILFRNKSGVPFTAEQIAAVAHQKGLLEHTRTIEDIIDLGEKSRFKPFGGKVQAAARGASELTNHSTRLAHFIDKVSKSKGTDIETIFEEASRRTRKWHPTGLDLTPFEKQYLRRIMPFYSWLRKSTPLLLEGLVMNPGKAVIPAKMFDAIQSAQGIDTPGGRYDPFPVDQMFPDWIRAQGVGPVSLPGGLLSKFTSQQPPGYSMAGVGLNPLQDLMAQLETPGKTLASSITPAIGIPTELATGRKTFTQEAITGLDARPGALQQYIGEQIPGYSSFQGITGITPFGSETKKGASKEALINWFTAAGLRGTGPYVGQARYEELAPGKMKKKVGREEFLEELRRRLEEGNG